MAPPRQHQKAIERSEKSVGAAFRIAQRIFAANFSEYAALVDAFQKGICAARKIKPVQCDLAAFLQCGDRRITGNRPDFDVPQSLTPDITLYCRKEFVQFLRI